MKQNDGRPDWTLSLEDGLHVVATQSPNSPILDQFWQGYDKAFVLPDERETLEGFRACLALNSAPPFPFAQPHRELVITLSDGPEGPLLGGANFLATRMPALAGHPPVAVALNYVFVDQAVRGRGLSRHIVHAVKHLSCDALELTGKVPPAVFIEQNDPLRLTPEEYATESAHAGIDQIDRLAIWARLGARLVDFPYIQPALSSDQASDDSLAYAALAFPSDRLHPIFLREHLRTFFGISVLKGRDPAEDPVAGSQLEFLQVLADRREDIALVDMTDGLERLRAQPLPKTNVSLVDFILKR